MLLQVMETGGDLNQTLQDDPFDAVELAPGVFPELVRLKIRAAIESRPPLFEPVPHRFAERAHACDRSPRANGGPSCQSPSRRCCRSTIRTPASPIASTLSLIHISEPTRLLSIS